jgi:hypothetical protein
MSIEQQAAEVADETNEQSAAVENQFAEADAKAEPVGLEQLASEMGWVPQEKFKGPTDKWKPADQFIRDGKDIQERLSRDLKGLRETVETIKLTNSQTMIDALAKQHAELSQRYAAAVEKGDPDEAWRAANAIQQVQARAANIGAPQVAPVAPETENWVQRNDRIQRDPIAWQRALQVCDAYARANPSRRRRLSSSNIPRRTFAANIRICSTTRALPTSIRRRAETRRALLGAERLPTFPRKRATSRRIWSSVASFRVRKSTPRIILQHATREDNFHD